MTDESKESRSLVGAPTFEPAELLDFVANLIAGGHANIYQSVIQEVDRQLLPAIMSYSDGNQTLAAKILGLSRKTLRTKMKAVTELPLHQDLHSGDRKMATYPTTDENQEKTIDELIGQFEAFVQQANELGQQMKDLSQQIEAHVGSLGRKSTHKMNVLKE